MVDSKSRNSPECPSCKARDSLPARMILYPQVSKAFGAYCFNCHVFYVLDSDTEWLEWVRAWNQGVQSKDEI